MNRYFVFKKVRSLDVKKMFDIILNKENTIRTIVDNILEDDKDIDDIPDKPPIEKKKTTKKIKKDKIVLQK